MVNHTLALLISFTFLTPLAKANDLKTSLCNVLMRQNLDGLSYEELRVEQVHSEKEAIELLREYQILGSHDLKEVMDVFMELDTKPWPDPKLKLSKKSYFNALIKKINELSETLANQIDKSSEQKKTLFILLDLLVQRKSISNVDKQKELVHFTQIANLATAIKKTRNLYFEKVILEYARLDIYEQMITNGFNKISKIQKSSTNIKVKLTHILNVLFINYISACITAKDQSVGIFFQSQ